MDTSIFLRGCLSKSPRTVPLYKHPKVPTVQKNFNNQQNRSDERLMIFSKDNNIIPAGGEI